MARQRFIHPDLWEDARFGSLPAEEQVLFIALFSNADDDGRLVGDAPNLRAIAFRFKDYTLAQVTAMRDHLAVEMPHVLVYAVEGATYIQLTSWDKRQRPQYPKPSRLPPPPPDLSHTLHGSFTESSMNVPVDIAEPSHVDRDGLGRDRDGEGSLAPPAKPTRPRTPRASADAKQLTADLKAALQARGVTVFRRDWALTSTATVDALLRELSPDDCRALMAWAFADDFWGSRITHWADLAKAAPRWQQTRAQATGPPPLWNRLDEALHHINDREGVAE